MSRVASLSLALAATCALLPRPAIVEAQSSAPAPIEYRLSFPEPEQRTMHVEVRVGGLTAGVPLSLRMSRTSPGRYALHEFAKNVFDVRLADGAGRPLIATRPNPHEWQVSGHDGTVTVRYRVFGDRTDGTYLSVDHAHAHVNMPAALMWAVGHDSRPSRVTFERPQGTNWRVATQLFPTDDPLTFTAPNLQYLMDSPAEFSDFVWRTFDVARAGAPRATIRIALHHQGTDAEADRFAGDVERIVLEEEAIFGELAPFDGGTYTFLADYLPAASGDGMEHRNSTVLTSSQSLASARVGLLGTVAHEFFHAWNVERIRPRSLEPFSFVEANMSGELWLAEGVTSYYDELVLARSGLEALDNTLASWAQTVNAVVNGPGRRFRPAVEMSRLAPFVDAARSVDPTNWENTFISYYTFGAAIGLALDLSLRGLTAGKVTLDDYMRGLWTTFGRPGGAPGIVSTPYTNADARRLLAEVSGSRPFADDFFDRYVEGREAADYGRLLAQAGLRLRPRRAGAAWLGLVRLEFGDEGLTIQGPTPYGTPAHEAGLAQGDRLRQLDGQAVRSADELQAWLAARKPGDRVPVDFVRGGRPLTTTVTLAEDPRLELVTLEATGARPSPQELAFRQAWLGSRVVIPRP
jgi:predicted metalloprotease with PDZ domain